jgi:uncharacterized protein YndB with AHSA1/START domain
MNDRFDPGPLAAVEHRTSGARSALVFVRQFRHPPEKIWAALTDPTQLAQWAPFTADRDLGRLGAVVLTMTDSDDGQTFPGQVTRCEEPTLLEYTWGDDLLRWQLEPDERGTKLTLHHTTDDPTMVPKVAAGWHICLAVADRLLEGHPIGPIVGEAAMRHGWQQLHDEYADALGLPRGDS